MSYRFTVMVLAFTILIIFLLPHDACAWGPGVHLRLGLQILENLGPLPASLQALLSAYPLDFLYGCIAADITLGKKYTHHLENCHNWRIGHRVLNKALSLGEEEQACAYGYLSHLAADTIAHNYFIPYKETMTYNSMLFNHGYWEIRADSGIRKATWETAQQLARRDNRRHDRMLSQSLSDTIFSFRTNKQLFNSMMMISRLQRWHKLIAAMARRSKWSFDQAEHDEYMAMGYAAVNSILSDPQSPYWRADPTGERAFTASRLIRKNLNLLWLDVKLLPDDAEYIIAELRARFKLAITDPDELLPLFTAV